MDYGSNDCNAPIRGNRRTVMSRPDHDGKEKKLINHIINDFGGITFAITSIDKTLKFAQKFSSNKVYKATIGGLRYSVPAALTGYKIVTSYKKYKEENDTKYASDKKSHAIARLMGTEEAKVKDVADDLDYTDFSLGREVVEWLMTRPKTEAFKIINFYDAEMNIQSSAPTEKAELYVVFDYKDQKFVMNFNFIIINNGVLINSSNIYYTCEWQMIEELRSTIFSDFIKHFNTSENVIYYESLGLETRKRTKVEHDINQFDVKSFAQEIENVVDKGWKRGYGLVGIPGTGKSNTLMLLEDIVDIPFIYVTPTALRYEESIRTFFNFIASVSPCICIFEDMDSFDLLKKDTRLNEFLENMDSIKNNAPTIFIATMNDTNRIHYSLINRPGRFDQVYLIDIPRTREDVRQVMMNKIHKEVDVKKKIVINVGPLDKILKNKFTQADICEVVNKVIINDKVMNSKNINESIDSLVMTKDSIRKCNFADSNPDSQYE